MFQQSLRYVLTVLEVCLDRGRRIFRSCSWFVSTGREVPSLTNLRLKNLKKFKKKEIHLISIQIIHFIEIDLDI